MRTHPAPWAAVLAATGLLTLQPAPGPGWPPPAPPAATLANPAAAPDRTPPATRAVPPAAVPRAAVLPAAAPSGTVLHRTVLSAAVVSEAALSVTVHPTTVHPTTVHPATSPPPPAYPTAHAPALPTTAPPPATAPPAAVHPAAVHPATAPTAATVPAAFPIAHGRTAPDAPDPRRAAATGCAPLPADAVAAGTDAARLLQLDAVHRLATGTGQTIAVVDTGVAAHRRLGARLRGAGDLLGPGDGRTDCDGHGTAVAGLLAAAPGRDDDLVGMAPAARLLAIRQTGTTSDGRPAGDVDTLARAIGIAVDAGATVVNLSEAACLTPARAERDGARLRAALREAARRDVVVVAAAGNLGVGGCTGGAPAGEVALPGWFAEDVLTVAATGPDGAAAPFTVPGPWVDVAAPGTGLRSLAADGGLRGGLDGTSFAAPWVAGLAALVRERYPELTAAEVVDRILATARRPGGGRDASVGHGVVDPVAALTAVPARLRPDTPDGTRTAVLAGTEPTTAVPEEPAPPVELLAVVVLASAAGSGVLALRRRPDRP